MRPLRPLPSGSRARATRRLVLTALAVLAAIVPMAAARAGAPEEAEPRPRFSLRGKPLPECSSFLITEFGLYYLVNRNGSLSERRDTFATFDLGYMRNIDRANAAGVVLHLGGDNRRTGLGAGVRYRRWLGRRTSLNVTLGGDIVGVSDESGTGDLAGFSAWGEVGLTVDDMASLVLRAQDWNARRMDYRVFPAQDEGSDMTSHLGLKVGGPGGIFATAVLIVAGVAAVSSF